MSQIMTLPTNEEKEAIWQSFWNGTPVRVPLRWTTNPRIVLLDPALNPEGYTYLDYSTDPHVTCVVQSRYQEYLAMQLNRTCDAPVGLPDTWRFHVDLCNIRNAAYLGAEVVYPEGQVPSTKPFLDEDSLEDFLERDFEVLWESEWLKDRIAFSEDLVREAESFMYLGRKGTASVGVGMWYDGPLTVATDLMGEEIFPLLLEEPELATRFLTAITRGTITAIRELSKRFNNGQWEKSEYGGLADDSVQLISTETYRTLIAPIHELFMRETSTTTPADRKRYIHMCGDATRHFATIRDVLGVNTFDTGFPVDHGWLRKELGPDVTISGGPHIGILKDGTPDDCAKAARDVLTSGVMDGGRFILQEGNNLPPCTPLENLQAVYEVCQDVGVYPTQTT